jgi:hypothetical protein
MSVIYIHFLSYMIHQSVYNVVRFLMQSKQGIWKH